MTVTTRSQARAKNTPMMTRARSRGVALPTPPLTVTQRNRTGTATPKTKGKATASGKTRKSDARARKLIVNVRVPHRMSTPTISHNSARHIPTFTPLSPLTPLPSPSPGPFDMDTEMNENARFTTPQPMRPNGPRVRFDVQTLSLVQPTPDEPAMNMNMTDFAAGIAGDWVLSPGGTSQRLIVVPEDTSIMAERERQRIEQAKANEIFQRQYDILMASREAAEKRHIEFMRQHCEDLEDYAMHI
ncbi:hypothetical protein AAF712_014221 [Marasmius tenuissimus]|uniref:Uncharacterized protein n=1 Tax=Marasmius tenuissimus TaxID=585030 RepID=A0ABR2ZCV0_9AGAR|nr:hypothetical protein PM082_010250 [Marasmius tenuissimus]